jgi:hypothetical protein
MGAAYMQRAMAPAMERSKPARAAHGEGPWR